MKAKPVNEQLVVIALPSLIHRIGGEMTKHLKSVAAEHGCELKRVRRSRHWQISGEALALQAFYDQVRRLEEDSASYLVKKNAIGVGFTQREAGTAGRQITAFGDGKSGDYLGGVDVANALQLITSKECTLFC